MAWTQLLNFVMIGGAVIAALVAGIIWYNSMITNRALQDFNTQQLQQVIRDNEEFRQKLDKLSETQEKILVDFREANLETEDRFDFVNDGLYNLPGSQTESSQVLKETIRRLQGLQR